MAEAAPASSSLPADVHADGGGLTLSQASDPGYEGVYRGCTLVSWGGEGAWCNATIMDGERAWRRCVWEATMPGCADIMDRVCKLSAGNFRVLEKDFQKRRCVLVVRDAAHGAETHRFNWWLDSPPAALSFPKPSLAPLQSTRPSIGPPAEIDGLIQPYRVVDLVRTLLAGGGMTQRDALDVVAACGRGSAGSNRFYEATIGIFLGPQHRSRCGAVWEEITAISLAQRPLSSDGRANLGSALGSSSSTADALWAEIATMLNQCNRPRCRSQVQGFCRVCGIGYCRDHLGWCGPSSQSLCQHHATPREPQGIDEPGHLGGGAVSDSSEASTPRAPAAWNIPRSYEHVSASQVGSSSPLDRDSR